MKIGYFGDGRWAQKSLRKILAMDGIEVTFIVPRFKNPDSELRKIADEEKIPFLVTQNVNMKEFVQLIDKYSADLFVSMSFDQILKEEFLRVPPKGTINCHAGALPFYRGRNVLNWVLINDEESFGVTVHYVDKGIDTGDIIIQKHYEITDQDNYGTVLEKAHHACADVLSEAIYLVKSNLVERIQQKSIHQVGFYCGKRRIGDELIDWSWSSRRVFYFGRAFALPGPCARSFIDDIEIALVETRSIPEAPNYIGTPGEVVGFLDGGLVVKTGDNTILVTEIKCIQNVRGNDELIYRFSIGSRFKPHPTV